ncbi:TetR family transcriptional regulator C-terminal domain-containing protein [Actinophytocola sp. KF-1]
MSYRSLDDDLTDVVLNVHRRNAAATRRLANHPLTRAYLEAGFRILEREFGAHPAGDEDRLRRPLATLTRETVIAEVANGPEPLPRQGTVGSFRDRWAYFPDYVSDLTRYVLRAQRMPWDAVLAEQAGSAFADGEFSSVVHEVAFRRTMLSARSTSMRFRYSAVVLAMRDHRLYESLSSLYEHVIEAWERLIDSVLSSRGLALRPGLTPRDLAMMLTALNEGLALRVASDPNHHVFDEAGRRSTLGTAALALFAGAVDTGDGATLEAVVDELTREPS